MRKNLNGVCPEGEEYARGNAGMPMLRFIKTKKEDVVAFAPFFAEQTTHLSDFSLCFQFMWHKHFAPDHAVVEDCLVLKELYAGKCYFHYPLSKTGDAAAQLRAAAATEQYGRDAEIRLHFTNVPRAALPALAARYADFSVTDIRRWRDYLYEAEAFRTYAGGKYAGQRNHVNKFKKKYPDWRFRVYRREDEGALLAFLHEYDAVQRAKESYLADEEMDEVYELVPEIGAFGLLCGLLTVGEKIVACAIGERCGDMIVVHVEKALRAYEGAYPMIAQQFALAFTEEGGKARYLNRMDDAGDMGLRKSKLQYLPCEIVGKCNVTPRRAIDGVAHLPTLSTPRLTLRPVGDEDAAAYARLAGDIPRNRWWGYDWREDAPKAADGSVPVPEDAYFLAFARGLFREKSELPLGIYAEGKLAGEVVLHRFGYAAEAEIGVRLLPEYEGRGYASEAAEAAMAYAFSKLELDRVEAKHFRENARSGSMLACAGMRRCGEDDTFIYYEKTAAM